MSYNVRLIGMGTICRTSYQRNSDMQFRVSEMACYNLMLYLSQRYSFCFVVYSLPYLFPHYCFPHVLVCCSEFLFDLCLMEKMYFLGGCF